MVSKMEKTKLKEWNLSDRIFYDNVYYAEAKDIKEFLVKEEVLINLFLNNMITKEKFWSERNKLIGDKLK